MALIPIYFGKITSAVELKHHYYKCEMQVQPTGGKYLGRKEILPETLTVRTTSTLDEIEPYIGKSVELIAFPCSGGFVEMEGLKEVPDADPQASQ